MDMSEWSAGSVIHFAAGSLAWFVVALGVLGIVLIELDSGGDAEAAGFAALFVSTVWRPLAIFVLLSWMTSFVHARESRGFGVFAVAGIAAGLVWLAIRG